jgi:hypothetical protein
MPIMTDGPTMEPQNKGIDEFHVGRLESLGADIGEAVSDLPSVQLKNLLTVPDQDVGAPAAEADALGSVLPSGGPGFTEATKPAVPRMDIIEANDRVKKAGLSSVLSLPNQPDIPASQLEIMMSRAQARKEREATIERGPQGFIQSALSTGTSFLVGAVDPINLGSAFIPVMGELRYAKLLETAGEGFGARLAVRAGVGAAQGAVGQAALEPIDWWSHTQDGRDFGMSDVLHNVLFGAVLGGSLHAGGGAISDAWRARQGRPLYPFGPGEPMENVRGTHVAGTMLAEEGISPDALEEHFAGAAIEPHDAAAHEPIFPEAPDDHHVTPAALSAEADAAKPVIPSPAVQTIDDLPQRAREDAARAGIANLIDGEPLRVGEMLEAVAKTDPRIAESFEAWHASPHEFDRFDADHIGTGEGAQVFGHGLYFAENEDVARHYYDMLVPDYKRKKVEWFPPDSAKLWQANPNYEPGAIYTVRINADLDHLLDWDKPIGEQSAFVKESIEKVYQRFYAADGWKLQLAEDERLPAHEFYNRVIQLATNFGNDTDHAIGGGGKRQASHALAEAGIPGIKYLDQMSRVDPRERTRLEGNVDIYRSDHERSPSTYTKERLAAAERELADFAPKTETRNFVVFDDKHIEITHKNGEPVNKEQFLREHAAERTRHVTAKPARGRAAADPETWSLFEYLASRGGLKSTRPAVRIMFLKTGSLRRM